MTATQPRMNSTAELPGRSVEIWKTWKEAYDAQSQNG